ncbi:class I SAM-dependent rRNA methyltransferase [Niallia sp. 01092]|uniref:class I SAM-dependent rRNA methyltransferase n=1 Tax=unclassified Niallia TaxID=2837522 RepID=UPI003FD52AE0
MRSIEVIINPSFEKGIKNGNPLLYKEALLNVSGLEEGQIIDIKNKSKQFLGRGYFGIQNKGVGWILTFDSQTEINEQFFERQLLAAIEKRKGLIQQEDTTAFRLFNGEGDGIGGFTIDCFNDYLLIQWYSKGIYAFKEMIIQALQKCMSFSAIYEKKRFDQKGSYVEDDDFVIGKRGKFPIIVKENGMNYSVDLNDGAMVGIFLDQREVRKTIRDKYAKGKDVLNTFSYTGAFSVAAALGGSKSTTSVDLANRSRAKTTENFTINEIDLAAQKIIVEDVFHYFKYAVKKELLFDMVILDPPSFARSKKHTFSAAKDYTSLLKEAISITKKNGIIVASTNCSTFDMKKFKRFILDAFENKPNRYEIVEEFQLPADFRSINILKESNYLKVVFLQKK